MKLRFVRLVLIVSLAVVPLLIFARFESTLAAAAGGVWVVAVVKFWRESVAVHGLAGAR